PVARIAIRRLDPGSFRGHTAKTAVATFLETGLLSQPVRSVGYARFARIRATRRWPPGGQFLALDSGAFNDAIAASALLLASRVSSSTILSNALWSGAISATNCSFEIALLLRRTNKIPKRHAM